MNNKYYEIVLQGTDNQKTFSSFLFYNTFLPQLHNYFINKETSEILINFDQISRISPLAVPLVLSAGIILRDYFKKPVEIYLPPYSKLLYYLNDIDFIDLASGRIKNQNYETPAIFTFPTLKKIFFSKERKLGDFCETIYVNRDLEEDEIFSTYFYKYHEILVKILNKNKKSSIYYIDEMIRRIILNIIQLCRNGIYHSDSSCFATIQLNKYNNFLCSVSDSGIGFYQSFLKKIKSGWNSLRFITREEFFELKGVEKNIYAIFEAIFFRYDNSEHGLFDVFDYILSESVNGTIRVHSDNSRLVFTKNTYLKYFEKDKLSIEDIHKAIKYFLKQVGNDDSNVVTSSFRGVHIEFEIPLKRL